MPRPVPVLWLLFLLGLLTIPIGLTPDTPWLSVAILPAAAACAPVITATANGIAALVPDRMLGEAMGWHGGALTAGTALGSPLAGVAMDARGPWAGFAVVGVAGVLLSVVGFAAARARVGSGIRGLVA
jgi:predicted MFS family arabinose efflux permease